MKQYRYVKSNAFTSGESLGNPAACIFTGHEGLSPEQMQAIAAEHKGFVIEVARDVCILRQARLRSAYFR